jgi:hypothetical protein
MHTFISLSLTYLALVLLQWGLFCLHTGNSINPMRWLD